MIEVKEAITNATQAAQEYFEDFENYSDLKLEEVEHNHSENKWLITLGFNEKKINTLNNIGLALSNNQYIRKYKIFDIDGKTGKVLSMKIRKI